MCSNVLQINKILEYQAIELAKLTEPYKKKKNILDHCLMEDVIISLNLKCQRSAVSI